MMSFCRRVPQLVSIWRNLRHSSIMAPSTRLIEIGCLDEPKLYETYSAGQLFLHRVFGYRGVILFHWVAHLYDRDGEQTRSSYSQWEDEGRSIEKFRELKPERQTYYQVLIDQRDFSQVRNSPDAITLTADRNDMSLYSISGMDYVNHEDILPYFPSDKDPLQHELFLKFFTPSDKSDTPLESKSLLSSWHQKNICFLEKVNIHRETNRNIRVIVMPFFMGSRVIPSQSNNVYWWRYCIRIENLSGSRVQLRQRHWRIYSSNGSLETVRGDGVIGQQPLLTIRHPAFQYNSHVSLQSPSGHMWGTFQMEREDGKIFDIRIPPFPLESHES